MPGKQTWRRVNGVQVEMWKAAGSDSGHRQGIQKDLRQRREKKPVPTGKAEVGGMSVVCSVSLAA